MIYTIFNDKKVEVDKVLIEEYERLLYPVEAHTVEYMALNGGASENDDPDSLESAIKKGFEYEVYFATHTPAQISNAIQTGIIESQGMLTV